MQLQPQAALADGEESLVDLAHLPRERADVRGVLREPQRSAGVLHDQRQGRIRRVAIHDAIDPEPVALELADQPVDDQAGMREDEAAVYVSQGQRAQLRLVGQRQQG